MTLAAILVLLALILFVFAAIPVGLPQYTPRWEWFAAACLCGAWLAGAKLLV